MKPIKLSKIRMVKEWVTTKIKRNHLGFIVRFGYWNKRPKKPKKPKKDKP